MDLLLPERVARALTPTETRLWLAIIEQGSAPCRMSDLGILANTSSGTARRVLIILIRKGWVSYRYPVAKLTRLAPRQWTAHQDPIPRGQRKAGV